MMTAAVAQAASDLTGGTGGSSYGEGLWLFLLASLLVIGLTYAAVRLVGNWQISTTRGRRLRVLEGVPLGRDRSLLLVAVGQELLVVGSSPQGVQLVHRISDPAAAAALLEQPPAQESVGDSPSDPDSRIRQQLDTMRELLSRRGHGHER